MVFLKKQITSLRQRKMALPLPHESNGIVFAQYRDGGSRGDLWLTWSSTNKRTYFCQEPDCSGVAYSSLGYRCEAHYHAYIAQEREIERIELDLALNAEDHAHKCSGEIDYDRGYYVCDDSDDPHCPSYRPPVADLPPKCCSDCGVQRQETEPVLLCDWYCRPCWEARFRSKKSCADCGHVPENGYFPCYRGKEPLCADCEEEFYGPPSPDDWRERTGHCTKCDRFYDLVCSSDKKDLCHNCS